MPGRTIKASALSSHAAFRFLSGGSSAPGRAGDGRAHFAVEALTIMNEQGGAWTVLDAQAGVLVHTYEFAAGGSATTFAARMADGAMLVVSPSCGLTDALVSELLTFGPVGALVANNGLHHLGQAEWRARFPDARCFAPPVAAARIAKKNPAAGGFEPLSARAPLLGDAIGFRDVADTKIGECWFWVRREQGYAWYVSDLLANLPALPKSLMPRLLFQLSGSGPGYRIFNLALFYGAKDKRAVLRQLLDDLAAHPPTVIVPAHGGVLTQEGLADETRALLEAGL